MLDTRSVTHWYRPIGIGHGSDYIQWQQDVKPSMGPDFIGYLEAYVWGEMPPRKYGDNIASVAFHFFYKTRI